MNIWYAVYVKGQITNRPLVLFQYQSQALNFVKQEYPNRAEIKPVLLSGSLLGVTIDTNAISLS